MENFDSSGGDGIIPGTARDRPVSLGALIGKVKQGTGAIGGFREDRRNAAKTVSGHIVVHPSCNFT